MNILAFLLLERIPGLPHDYINLFQEEPGISTLYSINHRFHISFFFEGRA